MTIYWDDEKNMNKLKGCISGAKNTPYEGGMFTFNIDIPVDYPTTSPKARFETKI